ncbi:MAG: hypothetical protein HZB41_02475 [Ignavibacteriae bacterium]|nr:hypothetical protein [Ignavibacteriota bacterium]
MNVVLIASYVTIPAAMSLLSETNDDFLILTPDENIYELMSIIYDKTNVKLFEIPTANLNTCNPITLIHNIRQINNYKKRILQLINSIKDSSVYFDLVIYCDFEFWIIKKLSKQNKIFYLQGTEYKNIGIDQITLQASIYAILNRMIYHTKLKPCLHGNDLTLRLTDEYLHDVGALIRKTNIDYKILSTLIKNTFNIQNGRVLFLCGGVAGYHVNEQNYIKIIDEIIDYLIRKYGEEQIYIKAHPRFHVYLSKENQIKKISPLLPAQLVQDSFDIVIGYTSSTLFETSLCGKKVISLLKMIVPLDKRKVLTYIEFLQTNMDKSNPIYFPETIDEFKSILESIEIGEKHD